MAVRFDSHNPCPQSDLTNPQWGFKRLRLLMAFGQYLSKCTPRYAKYSYICTNKYAMIQLLTQSEVLVNETNTQFKRFLYDEINWSDRLVGVKGARGTGKNNNASSEIERTQFTNT
jgi:hypothetical protein